MRCRFCGQTFQDVSSMYAHLAHGCDRLPLSRRCPVCGRKFKSKRIAKLHLVRMGLYEQQHGLYLYA